MARLSLSLLGRFQCVLDGEPITDFATDKARALLAYLAVEVDRPHRRAALAGLLWPDQPQRKARQNLRQALSYLRQALGDADNEAQFLLVSRETVQLSLESDRWLDVEAFTTLISANLRHHHRRLETCQSCIRRLKDAVDIYGGSFLAQFSLSDSALYEEWSLLKREWLHRQAVEALTHLATYHERRGSYDQARRYAWRQVEMEPWREEAHRQLMRLLALDGQRSSALVQYETCRRVLAEELGVEPTRETIALYERIRADQPLHPSTPLHNLPHVLTPFVGREVELTEIADLLCSPDCRLLTLVGPGGIGKTRLALRTAREQIGSFAQGVFFAPLAPVSSAEFLVHTLADALKFSFQARQDSREQLLNYLREKEMLLVLDNFEHLLDGAELLAQILQRTPGVVLLVTSRERINLRGEWVYQVEGLAYPRDEGTDEDASPESLEGCSAIELFVQSASRADRHFSLTEADSPCVVRICRLLEGMPLGVELAAGGLAVRSCRETAQEIERNLDILTNTQHDLPERHRSMRATFEHSWRTLTEAEKGLLARLSVFRGGFRREAAAKVVGASSSLLLALLDKSLVRRSLPERYDMHELLRQFAAGKLEADPQEHQQTLVKHARYFAAFLGQQGEHLHNATQNQALQAIASEVDNVYQAWRSAVARGDVLLVEQSIESLYFFHSVRCRYAEGIELLAQVVERWRDDSVQADVFAKALSRQGTLYCRQGSYQLARIALEESLRVFELLGVQTERIFCQVNLADVARVQGKYEEAERLAQESLALSRQAEHQEGMARSLFLLGLVRYRIGDIDRAEALLADSLAVASETGNQRLIMAPLNALGDVACHRGDLAEARVVFEECLALSQELDDRFRIALHLNNLGTVLHDLRKIDEAQSCYQESLSICREIGDRAGQIFALSNLGEVAFERGDHREAIAFYQEGLSIGRDIQDQRTIAVCLNNLGQATCALEDYETAKAYWAEALRIAADIQAVPLQIKILVNVAVLFAELGQTTRAAELLEVARRHSASEQEIQERAQRLLDEKGLVPPGGDPGPLTSIVAAVLGEISNDRL